MSSSSISLRAGRCWAQLKYNGRRSSGTNIDTTLFLYVCLFSTEHSKWTLLESFPHRVMHVGGRHFSTITAHRGVFIVRLLWCRVPCCEKRSYFSSYDVERVYHPRTKWRMMTMSSTCTPKKNGWSKRGMKRSSLLFRFRASEGWLMLFSHLTEKTIHIEVKWTGSRGAFLSALTGLHRNANGSNVEQMISKNAGK